MNFKEAMEHYRSGTATDEETALVENELEKSQLIADYWDTSWDAAPAPVEQPREEMQQVRRSLRKRGLLVVLTSVALAAVMLIGTVYAAVPALEKLYWDPRTNGYTSAQCTDAELMLAAYTELFCPGQSISYVDSLRTGFASYELSIQLYNAFRGGENQCASASVSKGNLRIPQGVLNSCPVNSFDRSTYPFYSMDPEFKESFAERLTGLPDYVTLCAAVSFSVDLSMDDVIRFNDSLVGGSVGWIGIRGSAPEQQLLPLVGMEYRPWGTVRKEVNASYPLFDSKGEPVSAELLETHFRSLLKFCADQSAKNNCIDLSGPDGTDYYRDVLSYVDSNGIHSYGCYVIGKPEAFRALLESDTVSQIVICYAWLEI